MLFYSTPSTAAVEEPFRTARPPPGHHNVLTLMCCNMMWRGVLCGA